MKKNTNLVGISALVFLALSLFLTFKPDTVYADAEFPFETLQELTSDNNTIAISGILIHETKDGSVRPIIVCSKEAKGLISKMLISLDRNSKAAITDEVLKTIMRYHVKSRKPQ